MEKVTASLARFATLPMDPTPITPTLTAALVITVKEDAALSRKELAQLFALYNECFYDSRLTARRQIDQAKAWLKDYHTFRWYLAWQGDRLVGFCNYVLTYERAHHFAINTAQGENITSLGVAGRARRQGVAQALLERVIADYGATVDLVVEIKRGNPLYETLERFYQKNGFVRAAEEGENVYLRR